MSQSTIFMCVHLYFYSFWIILLWQKDATEFDQVQDNAKADFPYRLPCLLISTVGALWSIKSDKLQGRQSGCDTPTSTSAMLASTVPERLLGTDELIQGGQHVSFHRNRKITFLSLKSSFLVSIFHFVFMHVPWNVIKLWNYCPESLLKLTPVLLCSAPPLMTAGKCWLPPNPASISDRSWQVWPPSHMWVRFQALLESYEWPLQTHARWNELP